MLNSAPFLSIKGHISAENKTSDLTPGRLRNLDRSHTHTLAWIELLNFNAHTDFLWSDRAIGLQRSHRLSLVGSSDWTSTLTQTSLVGSSDWTSTLPQTFSGLDRAIGLQRLHHVDPSNQTQRSLLLICFLCLLPMKI